ncbi:hypothetical protein R1sor_013109 [Riccia sorocarpa]|uniref:AAA+ ATPase domain-containing protein n=1 Tax=Riccia sorocarpa TaxID=122646 RepID=A0ABD3H8W3_9MARC
MATKCFHRFLSCRGLQSDYRTLTPAQSFKGVTPFPLQYDPDGALPKKHTMEELQKVLNELDHIFLTDGSKSDKKQTASDKFCLAKEFCYKNVPLLGQICDKVGNAANDQTLDAGTAQTNGMDLVKEIAGLLEGAGQLEWVGAFFIVVGLTLDRFSKATKYPDQLRRSMDDLRDLGRFVRRIHERELDSGDPLSSEILHKAVKLICEHANLYTLRKSGKAQLNKKSFFNRFIFAETDIENLTTLQNEIKALYPKLDRVEFDQVHRRMGALTKVVRDASTWQFGENFTLSDKTLAELVGTGKQVDKASTELMTKLKENPELESKIHALVLVGEPGIGKSTIGQQVAAKFKREKGFSEYDCCKIDMSRTEKELEIRKKQKELCAKLSRGQVRKICSPDVGKRELEKVFQARDKPSLIYFDDAHEPDDLNQLLPDHLDRCMHPGSFLLVTTANKEIINCLRKKHIICFDYRVRELQEEDARMLLMKQILGDGSTTPNSHLEKELTRDPVLQKLLKFCGGVPLVIVVVGSFISSRGHDYLQKHLAAPELCSLSFDAAYRRLGEALQEEFLQKLIVAANHVVSSLSDGDPISDDKRLTRSLQFLCDQLENCPRMKDLFLDIVAVHLGRKYKDVALLTTAEDKMYMHTLNRLCMVRYSTEEKNGGSEPVVQVHGLLVGKARFMDNTPRPGRRMVLEGVEKPPSYLEHAKSSQVFAKPEIVKLEHCGDLHSKFQHLHLDTSNLLHLELLGTDITNCVGSQAVPVSLKYLKICGQYRLPYPLHLLQKLDLQYDLTHNIESIQSMPHLKELKLENSASLKTLGPQLQDLRTARIKNCPTFEKLMGLNQVSELQIVNCPRLQISCLNKLQTLKSLSLVEFQFTEFPEGFVIPAGVQVLDLSGNRNLEKLPTFGPMSCIKKLSLRFCCRLHLQWDKLCLEIPRLEELYLEGCLGVEQVFSLPEHFPKLKVLDLQGCRRIPPTELLRLAQKTEREDPPLRIVGGRVEEEDALQPGGCTGAIHYVKNKCRSAKSYFTNCKHDKTMEEAPLEKKTKIHSTACKHEKAPQVARQEKYTRLSTFPRSVAKAKYQ